MRYLAREMLTGLKVKYSTQTYQGARLISLQAKFPNQTDEEYAIPLARLLFYRYINPAIV